VEALEYIVYDSQVFRDILRYQVFFAAQYPIAVIFAKDSHVDTLPSQSLSG
jgi:hypothetical protein